ncbi:hypothetical protein [Streptomyces sp. NPDC014006]|uniref:hypothetical protein n=1 Tax=Streptomyces sp. NPDC014006 TaxID=3364870 RepID=UPI0036FE408E
MTAIRKALVAGHLVAHQAADTQLNPARRITALPISVPTVQQPSALDSYCSDSWWMRRGGTFSLADVAAASPIRRPRTTHS